MRRRFLFAAGATLAFASLLFAQTFREKVRVGLVTIRLDVRDSSGREVTELNGSDLTLRVDGQEVAIEGLDAIAASPAPPERTPDKVASQTDASPPAASLAAPTPSVAVEAGTAEDLHLALFFDETSSNPFNRRDVFRQVDTFLRGKAARGVHVMIERFDGQLHIECPWTTDLARAQEVTKKIERHMADQRMPSPSELASEIRASKSGRDIRQQLDFYARRTFDGIYQALVQFPADMQGKRSLVIVTDGTPLLTPFDLSLMLAGTNAAATDTQSPVEFLRRSGDESVAKTIEQQLQEDALSTFAPVSAAEDAAWVRRMAQVVNKAVELDVALYPIDSEAIDRGTNPDASGKWVARSMPGVSRGNSMPAASGVTARVSVVQSMEGLARTTGGRTILVPRKTTDQLTALASERTAGYLLTFRDPSPGDNRYHKIEMTTRRGGLDITFRRGYRIRTDEEEALDAVVAHLLAPKGDNPLQARLSFDILRKEGVRDVVAMRLDFPPPPEAPGAAGPDRDVRIWAVCADDQGNRADPISRSVKAARGDGADEDRYISVFQLGLVPGPYTWSVALRDEATGLTSFFVTRRQL